MHTDGWRVTEDVGEFLGCAGGFLRSRPALHTMQLTAAEKQRVNGGGGVVFGWLEEDGEVRAAFYRVLPRGLQVTPLTPPQADSLAAHLAGLGVTLGGVSAVEDTSVCFARAWQRHTGATPDRRDVRVRLHRLGTLTPPRPGPQGRGRVAGEGDGEEVMRWCNGFAAAVGQSPVDAGNWAASGFAGKRFTFWEAPDGTPVSFAGSTPVNGGMVRVDPVFTPSGHRARGYAGAVTVEVSRAALAAGATDVVLFADAANLTSTALYRRIGYVPVADFVLHGFS